MPKVHWFGHWPHSSSQMNGLALCPTALALFTSYVRKGHQPLVFDSLPAQALVWSQTDAKSNARKNMEMFVAIKVIALKKKYPKWQRHLRLWHNVDMEAGWRDGPDWFLSEQMRHCVCRLYLLDWQHSLWCRVRVIAEASENTADYTFSLNLLHNII